MPGRRRQRQDQVTPPESIARTERLEKALKLRREGKTYAEIGAELGISYRTAYRIITAAMLRRREVLAEDADQLIQLQLDRLELMWNKLQRSIEMGNTRAIEVGIKVMERVARLRGLDQPLRVHNTHELIELSDEELRQEAERMRLQVQVAIPALLPGETQESVPAEVIEAEFEEIPQQSQPLSQRALSQRGDRVGGLETCPLATQEADVANDKVCPPSTSGGNEHCPLPPSSETPGI